MGGFCAFWMKTMVGSTTILAILALCGAVVVSMMGMGAALADICAMAGSFLLLGGRYLAAEHWCGSNTARACTGGEGKLTWFLKLGTTTQVAYLLMLLGAIFMFIAMPEEDKESEGDVEAPKADADKADADKVVKDADAVVAE